MDKRIPALSVYIKSSNSGACVPPKAGLKRKHGSHLREKSAGKTREIFDKKFWNILTIACVFDIVYYAL